jgi:hypothetical protein
VAEDWAAEVPRAEPAVLDLSFAAVTARTLRACVAPGGPNAALRTLSLAGWRVDASVLATLTLAPNLELLSLAASCATDAESTLRKLSRMLPRLMVLDLSYCAWVGPDSIRAVAWEFAFPRLKHLVLVGCSALADPTDPTPPRPLNVPAGNYVAPWHARHYTKYARVRPGQPTYADYAAHSVEPVRCPFSTAAVNATQWRRACVLDAVRGRLATPPRARTWIDVWF